MMRVISGLGGLEDGGTCVAPPRGSSGVGAFPAFPTASAVG
jgi:hypothetical protein